MSKKLIWLIISVMTISLIGIVAIQLYWIKDSINNKRLQFKNNVTIALARTNQTLKEDEELKNYVKYSKFLNNSIFRTKAKINNFLFQQVDTSGNKKFVYGTFLDEEYKIPTGFSLPDTTFVRKLTSKKDFLSIKVIDRGADFKKDFKEEKFSEFKNDIDFERKQINEILDFQNRQLPIQERISSSLIQEKLKFELAKMGINNTFKFGVYESDLATPLKSGYFIRDKYNDIFYPLFTDQNGNSKYKIYVNFPNQTNSLLSDSWQIIALSLFFIAVIIFVFSYSIYQLNKQKRISKVKTDFINNMTHEFKTPIATINLALDAIKNPKIINNNDKVNHYVQMIRDENKRMHGQVESVLRISKLEKKQIDISKEPVDMFEVIEEAIEHVSLILQSKNGTIQSEFNALSVQVLGNHFHLTNVVVNILENAIKYSDKAPVINIYVSNTNSFFVFKVKDQGIGMSKQAQKYIFDKFYREEVGNVHNVKGHGLGLSYVKEIIESHQGMVYVHSEKGKGSEFTVKIPLI